MTFTQTETKPVLKRGLNYLFEKQKSDGSWKSEYYGNLKQGAAITSLVLYALSQCDKDLLSNRRDRIQKAFKFLQKGIKKNGYVSNVSGPDYSNYATALTLLAARNFKNQGNVQYLSTKEESKLVAFLIRSQLDETHDLKPTNDDYGGWDLSGWMQEPRPSPGTNISIGSFVLLALEPEKSKDALAAKQKSKVWIERVRNPDHGFHFHPKKDHSGNKAEWIKNDPRQPKSYGTATVDGLRALRALDFSDAEVAKPARWLAEKSASEEDNFGMVPGFDSETNHPESSWGKGLLYYYLMSLALEKQNLPESFQKKCRQAIPAILIKAQRKDGRWENGSARMREDDPLIATPFALIALSRWTEN